MKRRRAPLVRLVHVRRAGFNHRARRLRVAALEGRAQRRRVVATARFAPRGDA